LAVLDEKVQLARAKKSFRIDAGADPLVAGWQCFLEEMLIQIEPYFQPGRMITFRNLLPVESDMFQRLSNAGELPQAVCTVYIPPSVLKTMTVENHKAVDQDGPMNMGIASDSGIVLASRCSDYDVIINALLAHAPYHPGIDVYEEGQLLAGYTYQDLTECEREIAAVMHTHLNRNQPPPG
jgi:hypothetical protein